MSDLTNPDPAPSDEDIGENTGENTARNRWMIISFSRLFSVVLVVLGLLTLSGNVAVPQALGWISLGAGLIGAMLLPLFLVRKWRSPRP